MCPLRVLLILVSAVVALFAVVKSMGAPPSTDLTEDDPNGHRQQNEADDEDDGDQLVQQKQKSGKSIWRLLMDFATGRFLYEQWKASRHIQDQSKACSIGLETAEAS